MIPCSASVRFCGRRRMSLGNTKKTRLSPRLFRCGKRGVREGRCRLQQHRWRAERVFSHNRFLSGVFRRSGQAARGLYVRIQLPPRVFGMVSRWLHQRCQRDGGSDGRLAHCGLCAGDERGRSGYLPRSGDPCGLCGMDVPRPFAGGADHSHAARMHPGAHHRRVRASGGSGNLATGLP